MAFPYYMNVGPNVSAVNKDGTQNISLYRPEIDGRQTYTVPKENVDKYLKVINMGGKNINKSSLICTFIGAAIGLAGGKVVGAKDAVEYAAASIIGAFVVGLTGLLVSAINLGKKTKQARIDYIESVSQNK